MANGNIVALRISQVSPTPEQSQPPEFGVITDASTPTAQKVRWATTVQATISGASVAALGLDVIEEPDAPSVTKFRGKTVLRIGPGGPVTNDPAGKTSREFVGTVVSIYRRTLLTSPVGPQGPVYLLVKSGDLFFEDLATQFTVLTDR